MRATNRRIALSIYLDFVLIYGLAGLFLFFSGIGIDYTLPVAVIVTLFARAVLHGAATSPGMQMLSIDRHYSVEAELVTRESWLTLMLGVGLVWSGMEEVLRWIELPYPMPFFGFIPSMQIDMLIALVHGLLYVAAGWLILRLSPFGLWLGIALGLADACSTVLSWNLWDRLVPFWVGYRRLNQGLTVRGGEVEFLQAILPEGILVITLLALAALLANWKKFAAPGH